MTKKRIGILGAGAVRDECATELAADFEVALSTDDPAALAEQARAGALDAAALCNPDAPLADQLSLADALLRQGLDVFISRRAVPRGIDGLGFARRRVADMPLLELPARAIQPRPGPGKRLFDLLFSAVVLALGLIPGCFIALVIKLQDRGPVFFVQDRVGAGGRLFRFIKFRTMWPDADEHREWYESRHGREGHLFKLADDPRRTPFGRILRRFSVDEMPQFVHALLGRMSVVGPRPPLAAEVSRYQPWQHMRLAGWVGVTGLWQVCGRAEVRNLEDIVLLDALYLHNHSFGLDLRIILRTICVVFTRHGAY